MLLEGSVIHPGERHYYGYSPSKNHRNPSLVLLGDHKCDDWGNEAVHRLPDKVADGQSQVNRAGELDSQNCDDRKPNFIDSSDGFINLCHEEK